MNNRLPQHEISLASQATGNLGDRNVTRNVNRHTVQAKDVQEGFMDKALTGLAALGSKYATMKMQDTLEQAYLDGQEQNKIGIIEEELESNWMTKPFVKGGWKDQQYLADLAEDFRKEAEFIRQGGRELDQEEYLAGRRERIKEFLANANIQGTSNRVRGKALGMLIQQDEHLAKIYADEHSKFSAFKDAQFVNANMMAAIAELPSDLDVKNGVPIEGQVNSIVNTLTVGLEKHDKLTRHALQGQAIIDMYAQGHISAADQVFQALTDLGTIQDMPSETYSRIKAAQSSAKKSKGLFYASDEAQQALIQVRNMIHQGVTLSRDQAQVYFDLLVRTGASEFISDKEATQIFMLTKKSLPKESEKSVLPQAWAMGDFDTLLRVNGGVEKGGNEFYTEIKNAINPSTNKLYTPAEYMSATIQTVVSAGHVDLPSDLKKDIIESFGHVVNADDLEKIPHEYMEIAETLFRDIQGVSPQVKSNLLLSIPADQKESAGALLIEAMVYSKDTNFKDALKRNKMEISAIMSRKNLQRDIAHTRSESEIKSRRFLEDQLKPERFYSMLNKWKAFNGDQLAIIRKDPLAIESFKQAALHMSDRIHKYEPVWVQTFGYEGDIFMNKVIAETQKEFFVGYEGANVVAVQLGPDYESKLKSMVGPDGSNYIRGQDAALNPEYLTKAIIEAHKPDNPDLKVTYRSVINPEKNEWYVEAVEYDPRDNLLNIYKVSEFDYSKVAESYDYFERLDINKQTNASTTYGAPVWDNGGTVSINGTNVVNDPTDKILDWRKGMFNRSGGYTKYPTKNKDGDVIIGVGRNITKNPFKDKQLQRDLIGLANNEKELSKLSMLSEAGVGIINNTEAGREVKKIFEDLGISEYLDGAIKESLESGVLYNFVRSSEYAKTQPRLIDKIPYATTLIDKIPSSYEWAKEYLASSEIANKFKSFMEFQNKGGIVGKQVYDYLDEHIGEYSSGTFDSLADVGKAIDRGKIAALGFIIDQAPAPVAELLKPIANNLKYKTGVPFKTNTITSDGIYDSQASNDFTSRTNTILKDVNTELDKLGVNLDYDVKEVIYTMAYDYDTPTAIKEIKPILYYMQGGYGWNDVVKYSKGMKWATENPEDVNKLLKIIKPRFRDAI